MLLSSWRPLQCGLGLSASERPARGHVLGCGAGLGSAPVPRSEADARGHAGTRERGLSHICRALKADARTRTGDSFITSSSPEGSNADVICDSVRLGEFVSGHICLTRDMGHFRGHELSHGGLVVWTALAASLRRNEEIDWGAHSRRLLPPLRRRLGSMLT
jgi:hypothetical protein